MSLNLTQTILTQIAFKRLSGKAMTSGRLSLAEEKMGSSTQTSNATIFGQALPNNPNNTTAFDYKIQSSSDGSPGTVQRVILDLVKIDGTAYANAAGVEVGSLMSSSATNFNQSDTDVQQSQSIAPRQGFNAALGDHSSENTFHAYSVRLPANYQTVGGTDVGFDTHAGTSKALGDAPYENSFMSTGSVQFQIVPEFVSTITGTNNPYIPQITASNGAGMASTHAVDYYFDTFAGILFVQDPIVAEGTTSPNQPGTIKAFLYVGKFQNEIEGDSVDLHFSASEGTGFSFANNATASFTSGSGEGLTVEAGVGTNNIEFTLVNVISGSEQITDLGLGIHMSGSQGGGFSLNLNQSASFESGSAGVTVRDDGTSKIVIGQNSDNVHFNQITGSDLIITNTASISYLETIYETASVIYTSGSTKFGNSMDDDHWFTGSMLITASEFIWDKPLGSELTVPLVYDVSTGKIFTGSEYVAGASGMTQFHISASEGTGFDITNLSTASFTSGSGGGLTVTAGTTNNIEFTLVGVISSSEQLPSGILSSSTQDFATYSSSVETLIINATASITNNETDITNATASILVNETNITELQASASAGIAVSGSLGGVTSIPLMGTASFIGGAGITVTNAGGTLTIDSDTGELTSPVAISASNSITSLAYGGTASFEAAGTGLAATQAGGLVTYTITPDDVLNGATDTATFNFTSSNAVSASYALSSSYAVTASYAENAGSVSVTEDNATNDLQTVIFSSLEDDDAGGSDVNNDVTLKAANFLSVDAGRKYLYVSGADGYTRIEQNAIQTSISPTYNILTTGTPTTINMGVAPGFVNFLGSASIAGDLIVNGTTTTINTETLLVEDRFILLASGSAGDNVGGGIVVERSAQNIGTALFWDEVQDVWAVDLAGADASSAATKTIDFNLVGVKQDSGNPSVAPEMGVSNYKLGQMYVNTADSDSDGNTIWIYAT